METTSVLDKPVVTYFLYIVHAGAILKAVAWTGVTAGPAGACSCRSEDFSSPGVSPGVACDASGFVTSL
jgi:hypothetical protein